MFIDFFDMTVQRTAIATAANMCRNAPLGSAESMTDVIPNIVGLMQHSDLQIVESSCLCLARVVSVVARSPLSSSLNSLAENGAMDQLLALLRGEKGTPSIGSATLTNIITCIATLCRLSPALAQQFLARGIMQIATGALAHEVGVPASAYCITPPSVSFPKVWPGC